MTADQALTALMIASQAGDAAAHRALLKALSTRLRAYFRRRLPDMSSAEDLVQETLLAVHLKRATYDPTRPVGPWAYAIARRKLVDHFRRERPGLHAPVDDHPELEADDELEPALCRRDLEALLSQLPPPVRAMVLRIKIDGDSVEAVARDSGLSLSSVKVTVHRAVRRLAASVGVGASDAD